VSEREKKREPKIRNILPKGKRERENETEREIETQERGREKDVKKYETNLALGLASGIYCLLFTSHGSNF
jgi:hypothetical protein